MKKAILTVALVIGIISIGYSQVLQTAQQKKRIEIYCNRSIASNLYHQARYFIIHCAATVTMWKVQDFTMDGIKYELYQCSDGFFYFCESETLTR